MRDDIEQLQAEVEELRDRLAAVEKRAERNDKALIAYARAAYVGPSQAFTAAFEILDGGH